MSNGYERFESLAAGDGDPRWNQSFYYNFYDPITKTAGLIRLGLMENLKETNTWFVFFKDGSPIYCRTNMNLPYTSDRPANGIKVAGMHIHAVEPLKKTRIRFSEADFSVDLSWDERNPMENPLTMDFGDDVFPSDMAHVHLDGTANVTGHIVHRGRRIDINGTGFRDIGVGPRNWDVLKNYHLAWPVFEDGTALCGIRGVSTSGANSYMRMYHDGNKWLRVTHLEGRQTPAEDMLSIASAQWTWTDENGKNYEMTGKPLLRWFFPVDTFVVCEQIMEYRTTDGRLGYGLHENGYRLPWAGFDC